MNKMTVNMIAGAVLSSLLVIFGTSTFVNIIFPRGGTPEHSEANVADAGHGAKGEAPAASAAPAVPLPVLLAKANAEAGAAAAKKCGACHTFDEGGPNKIGPNLHGVVGRPVASHEGFAYSPALKNFGGNWDYEKLNCFITSPKDCVAGTKMAFAGIKKDSERADVIAYLRSISPSAPPLPAADAAAAAPAAGQAPKPAAANAAPAASDAPKPPAEANAAPAGTAPPGDAKPAQN